MSVSDNFQRPLDRYKFILASLGPGLVVMLADTEAGSVITAAQSGAVWGYKLLLFQFFVIPLLYMAQELAVRTAIGTGKGLAELIQIHFGRGFSILSVLILVLSCFGALVTEMSGLSGIGQMYGVPVWQTVSLLIVFILTMVLTGSYHSVEKIAIFLGIFELAFLIVAFKSNPDANLVLSDMCHIPLTSHNYLYLLAASIGTSIMPWTIYYQQSAIVDKKLGMRHLKVARFDTLLGAIICQIITAAILIAAATAFSHQQGLQLESIPAIAAAFTTFLGEDLGKIVFAVGLSGGALVATIVVCLAAAWSVGEATGFRHSLEHHPLKAPWFYGSFTLMLIFSGVLVVLNANLVELSIAIGVANALLLPVVLFFLFRLARTELQEPLRLTGSYSFVVAISFISASIAGAAASLIGIFA